MARLLGDNTDGAGLVRDLTVNAGFSLKGKRILLLGAGGAVRGALEPLLAEQPASVIIANRTVEKAELLAELFADLGTGVGQWFRLVAGAGGPDHQRHVGQPVRRCAADCRQLDRAGQDRLLRHDVRQGADFVLPLGH